MIEDENLLEEGVRVIHLQKNKIPHFELKRVLFSWCCIASIRGPRIIWGQWQGRAEVLKSFTNLLHHKSANTVRYEDERTPL
jgi:hypothetical protein